MEKKKFKFHYGYIVLFATIIMNIYYACSYSVISQFMAPILTEFPEITRTQFSLVFSIHSLSSALYLTQFGKISKLLKNENVPVLGGLGLATGFFIYSTATNIYIFYAGAFLVGLCAAFFSSAITITLLNRWFAKGQATLLAISMTAGALGGTIGSKIVGSAIGNIGYDTTLRYIAIGMVIVVAVVRILLRKDPEKLGIAPCFSEEVKNEAKPSEKKELPGITFKEALKTYNLYAILGVFLIFGMCFYATYSNLSVYMSDLGFDPTLIGSIFGIVFLVNAITMIPGGAVADWLGSRVTMITLICAFIACVAIIAVRDIQPECPIRAQHTHYFTEYRRQPCYVFLRCVLTPDLRVHAVITQAIIRRRSHTAMDAVVRQGFQHRQAIAAKDGVNGQAHCPFTSLGLVDMIR